MILLLKFGTLLGAKRTVHYLVMCLESLITEDGFAVPKSSFDVNNIWFSIS